ncbi:cytochrome P450 [Clavulina sp. PMI_390]|nr:cytochrome P450 [Clavulina sp. PMI_390]
MLNFGSWPTALAAGTVLLAAVVLVCSRSSTSKKSLPPGPRGVPWIGQVLDIPMLHNHLYYTELAAKYGDVYTVTALGQRIIVLNSYHIAFDLLAKRGSIHCGRPPFPYLRRFLGLEHAIPLIGADHSWKEGRRLYQTLLGKEVARANYSEDMTSHLRNYVLHTIEQGIDRDASLLDKVMHKIFLQSTYGMNVKDEDPLLLHTIQSTNIASYGLLPARHLVDSFPILQHLPSWIPFQTWRIEGDKSRPLIDHISDVAWDYALTDVANGTAEESFVQGLLREQNPANEHLLKVIGLTNMLAGVETTNGICRAFILAMLFHPEELDRVLGHDLPSIDSLPDLPYFDAVLKEVLRWRPVAPISVPTMPTKDDMYEGYLIPRNSVVIQNNWAISRDERIYPDAESFNPERWFVSKPPIDPRLWTFGLGRRICPGLQYAELVYASFGHCPCSR